VPQGYRPEQPLPLAVMLHGAGGSAVHGLGLLQHLAESTPMLLLAPPARRSTWDIIYGSFGPDITFLDQALALTFERCAVDPARIALGGFSDGASYALSAGLMNGDLFTHIMAFSPGFMAPAIQVGEPRLYIAHGTEDEVLPIERCSRRIVPLLQGAGYDLRYREFAGPHILPSMISAAAVAWFTAPPEAAL
jgi:predicted esterase